MIQCIFIFFCLFLYADPVEDLKKQVCDSIPSFYGWCTKEKALSLIDLVLEVKPDVYVEIGVFGGRSLFPVASALKYLDHGVAVGIDPWDKAECIRYFDPLKDKAHLDWWSKVNYEQIYYSFLNKMASYQLEDYVITLRTSSELAVTAIGTIDILYLDGNHSETTSVQDVRLYLPKVRPGGYIWLNDSLWSDLQTAAEILSESCDFVKLVDSGNCILFRKRPS